MNTWLLGHEPLVRLSAFAGVFVIMAVWEALAPRRARSLPRLARWPSNLVLVALNTILLRVIFPIAAVGMAYFSAAHGWGLIHALGWSGWPVALLSVVLLDLAIYLQHVLFHAVPVLWRLHRVHHADLDIDVTTGARFHPIEILLSMLIKLAVVAVLGAPPAAVLIFEVLLNATAMFNHANAKLPVSLDRVLRLLVVTPDMHRVHHSLLADETNSNFGFNLPWWDRLCGTYKAQPAAGHTSMTIGLDGLREPLRCARLDGLLLIPFSRAGADYAINRRWADEDPAPK